MATAIVIDTYGGPEVLRLKQVEVGTPEPDQVRIRHTRIGVNFHDVYVRSGLYKTLALPGTPGIEAAGEVLECGSAACGFRPGDRVAYVTGTYGVYASERLIDARLLMRVPEDLTDTVVASALLRGLTVDMLLMRVHRVTPGMRILVQAAAGGVGQLLCQWASHIGAEVIGTVADDAQAQLAKDAGCHHLVYFRQEDVAERVLAFTDGQGVAVAYDGVGKDSFAGSLKSLGMLGHLVNFGQASGAVAPFEVSSLAAKSNSLTRPIVFHHVADDVRRAAMAASVFDALRQGWLRVRPPREFALADAAESHRMIEATGASTPLLLVP